MKRNVQSPLNKLRCAGNRGAVDLAGRGAVAATTGPAGGLTFGSPRTQLVENHIPHKMMHSAPDDCIQGFMLATCFC
ncbi:MAG: hypothetical protein CMJ81_16685 [Planctomycetaceae bacterium]|nr:hypothetical protein [Planctomycetaceae bacterium]